MDLRTSTVWSKFTAGPISHRENQFGLKDSLLQVPGAATDSTRTVWSRVNEPQLAVQKTLGIYV